ncbi:D-ornithine 4,5-aminomutase [Cutibacterium acnes JCM 18909]|nr:D-ornithine 4,5-aminomutase [Cutibacterium acnes JCM 18909]
MMAGAQIFQIDGAHNANATARHGWKVMPELMVQHGLNCMYSVLVGMPKDLIGLSTVPPSTPPAPKLWYDLPYAVALRDLFSEYKMRAQQNTRYIESDLAEAIRTHTIDTLISMLTSADIQSTITPDEGRNLPWHHNSVRGVQTVKQTWAALDGIKEMVTINREGPLGHMVRDLKERAIGFLTEMLHVGGYFVAVENGFFVDSADSRSATTTASPATAKAESPREPSSSVTPTISPQSATISATTTCPRVLTSRATSSTAAPCANPRKSSTSMSSTPTTRPRPAWPAPARSATAQRYGPRLNGPVTVSSWYR